MASLASEHCSQPRRCVPSGKRLGGISGLGRWLPQLADIGPDCWKVSSTSSSSSSAEGTKVILKGLTALQYNGQVGKILKNCPTSSTQDTSGPDERAQAQRENHISVNCSCSPVIIFPKNHAGRTQYTRKTDYEHYRDHQRGGGPIGRHHDAVKNGQSPCELERYGWYTDEIQEAVGILYEMEVFGLSLSLGSGI